MKKHSMKGQALAIIQPAKMIIIYNFVLFYLIHLKLKNETDIQDNQLTCH